MTLGLAMSPKYQQPKEKIDKLEFTVIENFCVPKTSSKVNNQPTAQEKMSENHIKGLYPEYIKNLYNAAATTKINQ